MMLNAGHLSRAAHRKSSSTYSSTRSDASKLISSRRCVSTRAGQHVNHSSATNTEGRKNPDLYASSPDVLSQQSLSWRSPAQEDTHEITPETSAPEAAVSIMVQPGLSGSGKPRGLVKPEVLSPAGGWPQMRAAVENGADAVYFGLSDFNARARASNFEPEELPEIMSYLHDRGVKGFVAMNVLVFDDELPLVEERVRQMAEAGVDAVIVQDLGVVSLMRAVAPNLPVHGSTQMSITSPEGADFAAKLGVDRVVVGRELSISEIAKVKQGTDSEVEAFVHGALCVSYSGQCFSSEAWGGRSANRGQCAQACRMPYGLLVDGVIKELGDMKYLLSPSDLMAVELVPQLIQAGVACFKIEGRLKGPEYVALTTQVYRQAVDTAWEAMGGNSQHQEPNVTSSLKGQAATLSADTVAAAKVAAAAATAAATAAVKLSAATKWELQQVFARGQDESHLGLTPGFLEGVQHQRLVRGRSPRHRGVFVGRVVRLIPNGVVLLCQAPIKVGDGVVFDAGTPELEEEGGSVVGVLDSRGRPVSIDADSFGNGMGNSGVRTGSSSSGSRQSLYGSSTASPGARIPSRPTISDEEGGVEVQLVFDVGYIDLRNVFPGDRVWRTKDAALESRLRSSYDKLSSTEGRKIDVHVAAVGRLGEVLSITLRDPEGRIATASTTALLAPAAKRPMTGDDLRRALGVNLGNDSLTVASVDVSQLELSAGLFLPASELKSVRRQAADALIEQRRAYQTAVGMSTKLALPSLLAGVTARAAAATAPPPHTSSSPTSSSDAETQQQSSSHASSTTSSSGSEGHRGGSNSSSSNSGSSSSSDGGRALHRGQSLQQQGIKLRVLCRSPQQVHAALKVEWLTEVVLDFLEVQGLKEATAAVQQSGRSAVVATPRVLKPDEERLWQFYLKLGADALLVRSAGLLHTLNKLGGPGAIVPRMPFPVPRLEGDFSLNAANALSADLLLSSGLSSLALTHDLSAAQMAVVAGKLGPRASALEMVLHQHLPIFHTEHCVFCRFLSDGNSYKDCGHPCESKTLHLRDQGGADHLVLADMGCRNTVFNAKAQSGLFHAPTLLRSGFRTLRVELVDEPAEYVAPLLQGYHDVLVTNSRTPSNLWSWLAALPDANGIPHGVAGGALESIQEQSRGSLKTTAAALSAAGGRR